MTVIRKMNLQMVYSQHVTGLATDYDISNDRFGFKDIITSKSGLILLSFTLFNHKDAFFIKNVCTLNMNLYSLKNIDSRMIKVMRLNGSDLHRIVKQVINEIA